MGKDGLDFPGALLLAYKLLPSKYKSNIQAKGSISDRYLRHAINLCVPEGETIFFLIGAGRDDFAAHSNVVAFSERGIYFFNSNSVSAPNTKGFLSYADVGVAHHDIEGSLVHLANGEYADL